jgi:predicted Zn-dependent peptidase
MRRHAIMLSVMVLASAMLAGAAEIPDRPEELEFPPLEFEVPDADALRFELSNGTAVYALADRAFPLVSLRIWFRGGQYLEPDGKQGLAAVTGEAWRSGGAGELTAQELDEELDFLAAIVSTNVGDTTGSVSLNVLSKDLDRAMELVMDLLTEPRFQDDRVARAKDDALQAMKTRNDDTAGIERREWQRLIYGDDFWMNRLATQASIESITPDDCKAMVARLVRAGNVIVSVSGDFDRDEMKALLEKTVGTLPALESPIPPIPQPDHAPKPGVYAVNKEDVNQGRVRLGQLGFEQGHPQEFALRVGNDILGGGGFTARMMKRIRSDEGLAYSAYSSMPFPADMPGTFSAYFQSKSSTCAYATEIAFDLIEDMRSNPPTDEEIATAKASFIETFPRNFESPSQTVSLFAQDELFGRDHAYWTTWRDNVRAVGKDDVQEALAAQLDPSKMVVLVVGNISEILEGHPDHEAEITEFGEVIRVPLRDPMTLEPMAE